MNTVEQFKKTRALQAEAEFWRRRAIAAIGMAAALAFLILCFGIGQIISGG